MAPRKSERDHIDDALEVWAREIPGLDPVTEGIIERTQILAWNFDHSMDQILEAFDLDRRSYSLLGKLRKYGKPYRASAGKLAMDLRLSSGAMTNRLDRMEAAGLIRRLPDPHDRRGTIVEPTELGLEMWDKTAGLSSRREAEYASVLSATEKRELHDLLRKLMRAFPDWKVKKAAHHGDEPDE
jgi:DNA-binding MarR family transcriptional regulator